MAAKTAPAPHIALLDPELDMVEFGHPNFSRYVNRSLFQSGYIVLRNAVDRNRCAIFRGLIRRSHEELAAKLKRKGIAVAAPAPKDKEKGAWHELGLALQNGQVTHSAFGLVNPGLALDDVIADWRLYSLLQSFFGADFQPAASCRTQWLDPASAEPVVHWRNDALHDGGAFFGLTVWVPLEDCGIDA
ncbi:MAG TPA: hypothetical protein VMU42_13870, partial [Candidatus Sulfotelmatobacter sp.]|nr:hypothetical protein [Candidatus Sulfotelmatobacter sp.]